MVDRRKAEGLAFVGLSFTALGFLFVGPLSGWLGTGVTAIAGIRPLIGLPLAGAALAGFAGIVGFLYGYAQGRHPDPQTTRLPGGLPE